MTWFDRRCPLQCSSTPWVQCSYFSSFKNGIEEIVDIKLNDAEKAVFEKSAVAVRNMNADLKEVLA